MASDFPTTPGILSPELKATIVEQVCTALKEDIGDGDLSASALENKTVTATVISRTAGILAGIFWFDEVFSQINTDVSVHWYLKDGDIIRPKQTLCRVHGNGRSILTGERCALNFLQTLSATATAANQFVKHSNGTIKILDTRKTIPGLRAAQKYAVVCGGACNHRHGLFDGILLKENHICLYGSIKTAVSNVRKIHTDLAIEVEVENLQQVREAIAAEADIILLDNFSLADIQTAVKLIGTNAEIEVSGGVTLENIAAIASTGINRISVGAITKNLHALDLSMRFLTGQ